MFVVSKELPGFGIGKLVSTTGGRASIEFFDSPVSDEHPTYEVSTGSVQSRELAEETRVFYRHPDSNVWHVGRVLADSGDTILVGFPNSVRLSLPAKDVFVRWERPIIDPTPYLAYYISQTPYFATARRRFLRSVVAQRTVAEGMSGLLSSVIELESHQISVVRRVLQDPVQRYLLADEVGLGKTIEAGILIRQYVLDAPVGHNIAVIVPAALQEQWREELSTRFLLGDYLDDSVFVICRDDKESLTQHLPRAKMLVVDEAHHIALGYGSFDKSAADLYNQIRTASQTVDRLLLLSATPVLGNEKAFLAMLHLLDSKIYELGDEKSFRRKIENRQALAELVAGFIPENVLQLDGFAEQLVSIFPEDQALRDLVARLRPILDRLPDETDEDLIEAVGSVRAHITETYRLHRRILRNRRRTVHGLTPTRAGIEKVGFSSAQIAGIAQLVEEWRSRALSSLYGCEDSQKIDRMERLFAIFVESLLTDVVLFGDIVRHRLDRRIDVENLVEIGQEIRELLVTIPFFENEKEFLREIADLAEALTDETLRFESAAKAIERTLPEAKKIVVFCTYRTTADRLFEYLKKRFTNRVVRHSISNLWGDEMADETPTPWRDFLIGAECNILVCDRRAEEGLNLQGGRKWVMHFDLPLSPNRVEQRMGRLDRYGSGYPIRSVLVTCESNEYESAWNECLESGFGVFEGSIASLQYLIDDKMAELRAQLLIDGVHALHAFKDRLAGQSGLIATELRRIDEQDELDALQIEPEGHFGSLYDLDGDWRGIQEDLDAWIEKRLMFEKVPSHVSTPYPPDKVFRYQYVYHQNRQTLISLPQFREHFLLSIDIDAPGSSSRNPRTYPYSFRRPTAVSKGVRLLRIGDDFLNGVTNFTEQDDRGKVFAMWRFVPGYKSVEKADLFFKFDFIVEADLSNAIAQSQAEWNSNAETSGPALKRRADMIFPPIFQTIWLDVEGQTVRQDVIETVLDIEYVSGRHETGWMDFNLNPNRWKRVRQMNLSVLGYWKDLCFRARNEAETELRRRSDLDKQLEECIDRATRKDGRHYAQLRSRIVRLEANEAAEEQRRLQAEQAVNAALYQGIRQPKILLDTIGAIFVSGTSLAGSAFDGELV